MSGVDVLVVGAGPAGWAAAAACAREQLQVQLVAPSPHVPWHQTYGAWVDELSVAAAADITRQQWDTVRVRTAGPGFRTLPRSYCLIDNELLHASLRTKAVTATVMMGRARSLEHAGDHLCVHTTDGARLRARAVIDATGHPAAFGTPAPSPPAYQTAYGLVARLSAPPIPAGTMCLMDFDPTPFEEAEPPTFLYAMDLGAGRWFVEETSLAARPAVPLRTLRQRLEQRLAHRGVTCTQVIATERCAFAMDAPLPRAGTAIAFGAAAAMVHPATGYHVAEALRRAPALAASLRQALADHRDPSAIARAAHRAVWPAEALRRHTLFRVGLEVLLGLDARATRAFFDGFFALPLDDWRGYVSRTSSTLALQRTMLRLMRRVPQRLRGQVLRTAMSPGALRTLSGVVAPRRLTR